MVDSSIRTRDVKNELIEACKDKKMFGLFVNFVDKQDDLELCFRGGGDSNVIIVYRHNHTLWEFHLLKNRYPVVRISINHCRFMKDWDIFAVKGLMDIGFTPQTNNKQIKEMSFEELKNNNKLLSVSNAGKNVDVIQLEYCIDPCADEVQINEVVETSYDILSSMMDSYFSKYGDDWVEVEYSKHKKMQPINYPKAYAIGVNPLDTEAVLENKVYASPQVCTEKHVQQELFSLNKNEVDGLFIYDLEFVQPAIDGIELPKSNKPDMFAVRYERCQNESKMVSIALVEVKSTEDAFIGKCGVYEHMLGMMSYMNNDDLMNDRRLEAYQIRNRYCELGLRGLKPKDIIPDDSQFRNLSGEIIFVFSHGYTMDTYFEKVRKTPKQMLIDAINDQHVFELLGIEDYSDKIISGKECNETKAYRILIKKK